MTNKRDVFQTLFKRFGLLNRNCCEEGDVEITPNQSQILFEIEKRHNPSMQEVAESLGIDISTFSRQIQTLVKMEFVKKAPAESDRRIFVLSLTEAGKKVAKDINQQMEAHLDEIFSHLDEHEQKTVLRSMEILNQAMAKSTVCCKSLY